MTDGITLLGAVTRGSITADQLETFPAPFGATHVEFVTEELTAFCPITHQPDLYRATISYRPKDKCLESKALKLYLHGYRDKGVFCEALAAEILSDIVTALEPAEASVSLRQQVRGGLTLTAVAAYPGASA